MHLFIPQGSLISSSPLERELYVFAAPVMNVVRKDDGLHSR